VTIRSPQTLPSTRLSPESSRRGTVQGGGCGSPDGLWLDAGGIHWIEQPDRRGHLAGRAGRRSPAVGDRRHSEGGRRRDRHVVGLAIAPGLAKMPVWR
jgi:hypothetical protein